MPSRSFLAALLASAGLTLAGCDSGPPQIPSTPVPCTERLAAKAGESADRRNWIVGVSFDGTVAAGTCGVGTSFDAYRWTAATGTEAIGPADSFSVLALSRDGSTILAIGRVPQIDFSRVPEPPPFFRWTRGAGLVPLAPLPGDTVVEATGMSTDGAVVVGSSTTGAVFTDERAHAFRWTEASGTVALEGFPAGTGGRARFVSDDGRVVAGDLFRAHTDRTGPVNGTFVSSLDGAFLEIAGMYPMAMSADGTVIVGQMDAAAVRWTKDGGIAPLEPWRATHTATTVLQVSADGAIAVGWSGALNEGQMMVRWGADNQPVALGTLPNLEFVWTAVCASRDASVVVATDYQGLGVSRGGGWGTEFTLVWDVVHGRRKLAPPTTIDCVSGDGRTAFAASPFGQPDSTPSMYDALQRSLTALLVSLDDPATR